MGFFLNVFRYICIYVYMYICLYIYIYMYIYIYVCIYIKRLFLFTVGYICQYFLPYIFSYKQFPSSLPYLEAFFFIYISYLEATMFENVITDCIGLLSRVYVDV